MELSARLQAVADLITPGRKVADIGCDHGYTSIYLSSRQVADKVIAMDVRSGPLSRAVDNIALAGLSGVIETRLSDGMEALNAGEVDTVLLSGMGGHLMIHILTAGFARVGKMQELILQPQSDIPLVREYVCDEGYEIVDEAMVYEDGKYYTMMKAVLADGRCRKLSPLELQFGPILLQKRPPVFLDYLAYQKEKTERILAGIADAEKKKEHQQYLDFLREVMI